MAIPAALLEANGDKMLPLIWDDSGTNRAAVFKAIYQHDLNGEDAAHMGIATHEDGATWSAGGPVVLMGVEDGGTVRSVAGNSTGQLVVAAPSYTFGGNGHIEVASGGTAVQGTSHTCKRVILSADTDNASAAYVGSSSVTNDTSASTGGLQLDAGQSIVLDVTNTNTIWVNGATGVGVGYIYLT
jgi:hypothetical protein